MSNRLLLLVIAAGALALGWLALAPSSSETRWSGETGTPVPSVADADAAPPSQLSGLAQAVTPQHTDDALEPAIEPGSTVDTTRVSLDEPELAEAHWISGRVVFPPGTPSDERVTVVAKGRKREAEHRCEVDADGAFRIAFDEKTLRGSVSLEARYLYLEKAVRVDVRAEETFLLEPKLGGWIDGEIVLAANARVTEESLADANLVLKSLDWRAGPENRRTRPSGLAFEFTGLRPGVRYEIELQSKHLWTPPLEVPSLEPGLRTPVAFELRPGVTVEGRVVDEDGAPLPEVEVLALPDFGEGPTRFTLTGADGSFRLPGLAPGSIRLDLSTRPDPIAPHSGSIRPELELSGTRDGEVVSDIELVLRRGFDLRGRVLWPDGKPAAHAEVVVRNEGPEDHWQSVVSGEDGSFATTGLEDGRYSVETHRTLTEGSSNADSSSDAANSIQARSTWGARVEGVHAGTSDIVLTLDPGSTLVGIVRDDVGLPLDDFRIEARTQRGPHPDRFSVKSRLESFEDTQGAFELTGLLPGPWTIVAKAKGYGSSEPLCVLIPNQKGTVQLVVPRLARVEGIVLDPDGRGVSAKVVLVHEADRISSETDKSAKSGRFLLKDVQPGPVSLRAVSDGSAPSPPLAFTLEPGGVLTDVELRLQRGGRITGQVVDAAGRGLPARVVQVSGEPFGLPEETRADAEGHFAVEHLLPGTYFVSSDPTPEEMAFVGVAVEGAERLLRRRVEVELADGGTQHVILAPPLSRPIRLYGRITLGTARLAFADVRVASPGNSGGGTSAQMDDEGLYSLLLAAAGAHTVEVSDPSTGLLVREEVEVPDVESFHFDLAIAVGTISGRVRGADGSPLAQFPVSAETEESRAAGGGASTDAKGEYELTVPAGAYTVTAGRSSLNFVDSKNPYCPASISGVQVASGGETRGIDFNLRGGTLEGTVRDADGFAPAYASVRVFASGGEPIASQFVKGSGAFQIRGVPPGTLEVSAEADGLVGRTRVEAGADRTLRLELVLVPGARVSARVLDRDGQPVAADRVELVLADGGIRRGFTTRTGLFSLGSLPLGEYTVRAFHGGACVERKTLLTSGQETTVELRFE